MPKDKIEEDGRIQVTARLTADEVRKLDALRIILDRATRSNMIGFAVKDWMRRQLQDPTIAAEVDEILKAEAR